MPVIILKNGQNEVVLNEVDFKSLILEHMGLDACAFYDEIVEKFETDIEQLRDEIYDLKESRR